nr:MAG TPA: hypothetical protein [Caudoviricetes sp.]
MIASILVRSIFRPQSIGNQLSPLLKRGMICWPNL